MYPTQTYTHTHTHAKGCTHASACKQTDARMPVRMPNAWLHSYLQTDMCTADCLRTYTHKCIRTYVRTYKIHTYLLFVWFDSKVKYVPVNSFSVMSDRRISLGWTSTKQGLMGLAQGHNAVTPMRLEPAALGSRVKHSTTEPLRSTHTHTHTHACTHAYIHTWATPPRRVFAP